MFKVKKIPIETGEIPIVFMSKEAIRSMDFNMGDRVVVKWKNFEVVGIINVVEGILARDEVGLSADVWKNKEVPTFVDVFPVEKPRSVYYIKKRLLGTPLKPHEIKEIIKDLMAKEISNVEASFFVASAYVQRLSYEEEEALTRAIIEEGDVIKFSRGPVLDKHCIGGVPGNRTTPIIVPIIASAGYLIPKTSSRAITSPAGTADVVEIFANVSFSREEIKRIVEKTNGIMAWGGAVNLAPADDLLLKLRYPLRLDPPSFLLASILAKKASVSAEKVLIDIPLDAKVKDIKEARELAERFKFLGKKLGMEVKSVITKGDQPIGKGIGPALEARDVLEVLLGSGPKDLKEKALRLSGTLLEMAGEKNGYEKAKKILESGEAYEKFKEIVKEQRGKPNVKPEQIKLGKFRASIKAPRKMKIIYNSDAIVRACRYAGNPGVKEAGIYLHKESGEIAEEGEEVLTVFASDEYRLNQALKFLKSNPPFFGRGKIIIDVL